MSSFEIGGMILLDRSKYNVLDISFNILHIDIEGYMD